jgi:hypothetical protein
MEQHINAVSTIIIVNPFMSHTPLKISSGLLDYLLSFVLFLPLV